MEDCSEREENNELTRDVREDDTAKEEEKGFDNQYQLMRKSPFNSKRNENPRYDRKSSRSRSRSRNRQLQGPQRKSANAFINFMQDFKQNHGKVKGKDLYRLGGQRWREMSSNEKMPYVKAAKLVKQQSQQTNKNEQTKKTDDSTKKSDNQKDQKRKGREERRRSNSRTDESDVESDSATTGTAASMTSDDLSDGSS